MMATQINEVIEYLRKAVGQQDDIGLTDGQLLGRFLEQHAEAAVAALVQRHGPMVWGVCRRVLGNHHDAEDAFQATFLVLVRKARSVRPREMVGNWLYGVAHHTALKARATRAKRSTREKQVIDMPESEAPREAARGDLQIALDQELSRLPDKYRVALVLCDLEGKTRKEAARQLGLPEGTLAGRLTRGRALLARRLARAGVVLPGGSLAAVLAESAATAGVPAALLTSTIKTVTLVAAGKAAAAGLVSAQVAVLAEGVVRTMLLTKLKITVAVLVVGLSALTGGLVAQAHLDGQQEVPSKASLSATRQVVNEQAAKNAKPLQGNSMLSSDDLWGKWTGEKEGVKVTLSFYGKRAHSQAHWQVAFTKTRKPEFPGQSPNVGVNMGADLKCVPDAKQGGLQLYLPAYLGDNQEIKQSARGRGKPVGEVQRGAEGTVQLRIIPTGYENLAEHDYDYPAVEGLLLRRVSDPAPSVEAVRQHLRQKYPEQGDGSDGRLRWVPGTKLTEVNSSVLQKQLPNTRFFVTTIATDYLEFMQVPLLISAADENGKITFRQSFSSVFTDVPKEFLSQFRGLRAATAEERKSVGEAIGMLLQKSTTRGELRNGDFSGLHCRLELWHNGHGWRDMHFHFDRNGRLESVTLSIYRRE